MDNSIDYIKIACNGTKSHRNRKNEPPKSFTLLMHVHILPLVHVPLKFGDIPCFLNIV